MPQHPGHPRPRAASARRSRCRPSIGRRTVGSGQPDFPARVIQHETDHLDGVLFFDRMTTFETLTFLDEFSRYWGSRDDVEEE